MISTYLGYLMYTNNPARSLATVAKEPEVATAKAYYDANIGKVKSVDDFIDNYKLFSYAMKANGLEDMTYARGLMRQVLTSDLTSATSVANKLSDSRFRKMAAAYQFTTKGGVATPAIQSADQQADTVAAFQAATSSTLSTATADAATTYYKAHIGDVTSLAALEKDQKLYSYVLTAYGVDATTKTATVESLLESDLSDPTSALNKVAGAGYSALAEAVNVAADGSASTDAMKAQSQSAITATVRAYGATVASSERAAAATATSYYASTIGSITTVDGLLADNKLLAFVKRAFNLPSTTSNATLKLVLTSDLSDPASFANLSGKAAYKDLSAAFNFTAAGGLKTKPFQDGDQQQATVALYTARLGKETAASDAETAYYKAHIGAVTSVAALEHDPRLYNYVLTANGISTTTPQATVENVMEASPSSPGSVVDATAGSGRLAFARAFDVDASGKATDTLQAQAASALTTTTAAYMDAAGTDTDSKQAAQRETAYYTAAIGNVRTVNDLLGDKRLLAYVLKAFALPATTSTDKLQQVLTSDLGSSKSTANKLGGSYLSLADAFTFGTNGKVAHQAVRVAQSAAGTRAVDAAYAQQTLENEAGDMNTGTKLALYFKRVAPTIKDAYSILADTALLKVFQTIYNIPAASGHADIDVQAAYLKSKVNFKDLQNPAKLTKLVQRFAGLYDLANPDTSAISLLFPTSA